jgi:hypothetical protein
MLFGQGFVQMLGSKALSGRVAINAPWAFYILFMSMQCTLYKFYIFRPGGLIFLIRKTRKKAAARRPPEELMTWMPIDLARRVFPQERTSATEDKSRQVPVALRVAGTTLRAVFIACLLVITVRVSMPQNETIWTAYDTPGDLVRMALGFAVCVWIAIQLFRAPKDAQGYRTFVYFGIAAVPLAILCLFAVW